MYRDKPWIAHAHFIFILGTNVKQGKKERTTAPVWLYKVQNAILLLLLNATQT